MANLWIMYRDDEFGKTGSIAVVRAAEQDGWEVWAVITRYRYGRNKVMSPHIKHLRRYCDRRSSVHTIK